MRKNQSKQNDKPFTKKQYNLFLSLNGVVILIGFLLLGIGDIYGNNLLKILGILLMISLMIPLKIYFKRYQGYENQLKIKKIHEKTDLITYQVDHSFEEFTDIIQQSMFFKTNELALKNANMYRSKDIFIVVEDLRSYPTEIDKVITYFDGLKHRDRGIVIYYIAYKDDDDLEFENKLKEYHKKYLIDNLSQVRFSDLINEDYHPSNSYFYPGIKINNNLKTYTKHLKKMIHKKLKGVIK